ncbi:MAG: hypothetical protein L6Q69_14890 [Zoogloea sp.]|nr:hypothetical protein [Zoogloea sp.]
MLTFVKLIRERLATGARDPGDVMALLEKAVDAENAVLRNAYFDKTIG